MRQANQQKGNGPVVERFAVAPFPFSKGRVLNGPEPSRARCICAAKRTLDGAGSLGAHSGCDPSFQSWQTNEGDNENRGKQYESTKRLDTVYQYNLRMDCKSALSIESG